MRGTPPSPLEAEQGNIRNFRQTETEKRKNVIAKRKAQEEKKANEKVPPGSKGSANSTGGGSSNADAFTKPLRTRQMPCLPNLPGFAGPSETFPDALPTPTKASLMLENRPRNLDVSGGEDDSHSCEAAVDSGYSIMEPWDVVTKDIRLAPDATPEDADLAPTTGVLELAACISDVTQSLEKSWKNSCKALQDEFVVQEGIWESAALIRMGKNPSASRSIENRPEAPIANLMQEVLALCPKDREGALAKLADIVQDQEKSQSPSLGIAMMKVAKEALKAGVKDENKTRILGLLIEKRKAAGNDQAKPSKLEKNQLEDQISRSEFPNSKLDYCVRRVFSLCMSLSHSRVESDKLSPYANAQDDLGMSDSTDPWQ